MFYFIMPFVTGVRFFKVKRRWDYHEQPPWRR